MAKAISSEVSLEACNAAHEAHAGERGLIEYGLAAHTQMSDTLVAYLGDQRWPKQLRLWSDGAEQNHTWRNSP
jgi:hypothetical protein